MEASTCDPSLSTSNHRNTARANDTLGPAMNLALERLVDGNIMSVVRDGVAFLETQATSTDLHGPGDLHSEGIPPAEDEKLGHWELQGMLLRLDTVASRESLPAKAAFVQVQVLPGSSIRVPVVQPFANGGYADIFKATMKSSDEEARLVAIKIHRRAHLNTMAEIEESIQRIRWEYGVWAALKHPNILPLEGLVILDSLPAPGLVSAYKEHGDLNDFLKQNTHFDRLHMATDIANGLEYLHANFVIHGDLKKCNILVGSDAAELFHPLIMDFGSARVLERDSTMQIPIPSLSILSPPECIRWVGEGELTNQSLTTASDVYAFSLLLLELLTGKEAYTHDRVPPKLKCLSLISDMNNPLRPSPEDYPLLNQSYEFCWPIMQDCWKPAAKDRITSREAHERLLKGVSTPQWSSLVLESSLT
ncbi:kinase-like protein [Coprinellus micaceus]|uniref:Kinase-like protein n=1 Tax=Coprinellus micaceus TaxID=71717 RepID=A0A4Y7SXW3_COPMI|nr:kinase-like protein [Coprinellus micaceus]